MCAAYFYPKQYNHKCNDWEILNITIFNITRLAFEEISMRISNLILNIWWNWNKRFCVIVHICDKCLITVMWSSDICTYLVYKGWSLIKDTSIIKYKSRNGKVDIYFGYIHIVTCFLQIYILKTNKPFPPFFGLNMQYNLHHA
jgi:hypothetical protein